MQSQNSSASSNQAAAMGGNNISEPVSKGESVSFEIQVERRLDNCAAPPVKQRLEELTAQQQAAKDQLTLQMIQDKLDRAYERKAMVIASQVETRREQLDRQGLVQERKNSNERAIGKKIIDEMGQKLAIAEQKRQEQLSTIQEKARNHNERVLLIRERRTSNERAEEERVQSTITQKLTSAEERQAQMLNSIQAKAKTHNELARERAQKHQEEEQREADQKKTQLEEKLTRAATNRADPAEKARVYNQKVQERVTQQVSEQQVACQEGIARIEAKLNEAAERREGVIEQVKAAAAQSALPRSAAASQSPMKQ